MNEFESCGYGGRDEEGEEEMIMMIMVVVE